MNLNSARLADFTSGWERHPENDQVIVTRCPDIFNAASRAPKFCRAVILQIDEEQKARDRAAFQKLWEQTTLGTEKEETLAYNRFKELKLDQLPSQELPAKPELTAMGDMYLDVIQKTSCNISIIRQWRAHTPEDTHDHRYRVLNRVFFSQGTVIPNGLGSFAQVEEGDVVMLQRKCLHSPEHKSDQDKKQRLTVAVHARYG